MLTVGAAAAQAKEWKTVRIGLDATNPPFESVNTKGEIVGWEVDYAREICKRMNVTCTFQNQDWDGIIPALVSGKYDMIVSGLNITPAREKLVLFSDVYYAVPLGLLGQAANKSDDISPAALKGNSIGTQSATTYANYLEKYYKDSEIKLYPGADEPQQDLKNGRLDYTMIDGIVGGLFIEKSGGGCCRVVGEVKRDPQLLGVGVGAGFRKEDVELRDMFNKAIVSIDADGTYAKLLAPYFKTNIRGR